jgi:exodeoxyribonuclease VII large subunit
VARRPFDPSLARGPEQWGLFEQPGPPPGAGPGPHGATGATGEDPPPAPPGDSEAAAPSASRGEPIGVEALSRRISSALATLPNRLRVVGEVANLRRSNGHLYFTLRDPNASIGCVMWRSIAGTLETPPAEGDSVEVSATVTHWAPQGRTQLQVYSIAPRGLGSLEEAFRRLCAELRGLGWFDDSRKRDLPRFPRRIAVVTAAGSAALADCRRIASQRCPAIGLVVVSVRVQGQESASEVARAIAAIDRAAGPLGIEAICVTRGGGSIEDLAAFNERRVAEAVFRCRTPLVAAIGHESDTTVIELVADRRASTPSAAMMQLLPDRAALRRDLERLQQRLARVVSMRISESRHRLHASAQHEFLRRPADRLQARHDHLRQAQRRLGIALRGALVAEAQRLERRGQRLGSAIRGRLPAAALDEARAGRLARAIATALRQRSAAVESGAARLRAVGPAEVLSRGYALLMDRTGGLLRSAAAVPPGTPISVALADGWVDAESRGSRRGDPLAPVPAPGGVPGGVPGAPMDRTDPSR